MTGADRTWAVRYQPGNVVEYTTGRKTWASSAAARQPFSLQMLARTPSQFRKKTARP